ncbi:HdeD family acid-resistance protein [Streptomyces sp. L500]|uniref:HdeD family acid-resistance protein n=1 Tax=Streptomyces abikoensis TaxID=97398 RepID=UPI00367DD51B
MTFSLNDSQGLHGRGEDLSRLAHAGWQTLLGAGIASVALGAIVLAWPEASLLVVGVLFGLYLLVIGAFQLAGAFSVYVPGALRVLGFVSGALCVLLGLLCFREPARSILLLALWIGFGWLLRGVMLAGVALSTKGMPARGWQVFVGFLNVLAGIVMIDLPFRSIEVLTVVTGVFLVVMGVFEVFHAVRLRGLLKKATG